MSDAPILPASLSPSEPETISEPCVYCGQVTTTRGHIEELAYRGKKVQHDFPAHAECLSQAQKTAGMWKIPTYALDLIGFAFVLLTFFTKTTIYTFVGIIAYIVISMLLHAQVDKPLRLVKDWEKKRDQG